MHDEGSTITNKLFVGRQRLAHQFKHPNFFVFLAAALVGILLVTVVPPSPAPRFDVLSVSTYPPEIVAAAHQLRRHPEDSRAIVKTAQLYIDYGRAIGDARLVGAGLDLLQPRKDQTQDADILTLAATGRQYQHDFPGALKLLDQAIILDAKAEQALLTRASIYIVQGRYTLASADCRRLAVTGRFDLVIVCDATAHALSADAPQAYSRLEGFSNLRGALDPRIRGYALGLLGEIAMFQGWTDRAYKQFDAAFAEAPDDIRLMSVYADFLLDQNKPREAISRLAKAPDTDAVLVRRAIAYKRLGDLRSLGGVRDKLEPRFKANKKAGLLAHAREEARFALDVDGNASEAVELALANWQVQREFEDIGLVIRAAKAAGVPKRASSVIEWMRQEKIVVPALRTPELLQ